MRVDIPPLRNIWNSQPQRHTEAFVLPVGQNTRQLTVHVAGCQAVAQMLFFKYCKLAPAQESQFFLLFTFPFFTEEFHLSEDRKILVVVWSWAGWRGGPVEMPKQSFFFFFSPCLPPPRVG